MTRTSPQTPRMGRRMVLARGVAAAAAFGFAVVLAQAPSGAADARGELLYATHCVACHSVQIHWRAQKRVADWASLRAEVRRWATNVGLGWSDDEVTDVARYLNATVYRLPAAPSLSQAEDVQFVAVEVAEIAGIEAVAARANGTLVLRSQR